jgi:hypothetical protein
MSLIREGTPKPAWVALYVPYAIFFNSFVDIFFLAGQFHTQLVMAFFMLRPCSLCSRHSLPPWQAKDLPS